MNHQDTKIYRDGKVGQKRAEKCIMIAVMITDMCKAGEQDRNMVLNTALPCLPQILKTGERCHKTNTIHRAE